MYTRKGKIFPSPFAYLHSNFVIYPLWFLTAFCCDVMAKIFSRERGGASDQKNPDLNYWTITEVEIRLFQSQHQAKTLGHDVILYAEWKSTREYRRDRMGESNLGLVIPIMKTVRSDGYQCHLFQCWGDIFKDGRYYCLKYFVVGLF